MTASIQIDVVSDVVCPWCFVGKRRLESALAAAPEIEATVRWRPYQLDPTIPQEGLDRRDYMISKFGSEDRIKQIHANIVSLGAAEGISFDFDAIKMAPNTLDAHRVIRWAASNGSEVQNRLVNILFSAYFEQGQNIGDRTILLEAAQLAGMDVSVVETLLPSDADIEAVQTEIATASRMGITGVPCFLLENKYAVMGAQDASVLTDAIRQVAQEKANSA
ncbi:MAG: DsbA family protein [Rhizobiaceae bacterium]|nr:DsbA family protein [Rhizobiaceae bacterium]